MVMSALYGRLNNQDPEGAAYRLVTTLAQKGFIFTRRRVRRDLQTGHPERDYRLTEAGRFGTSLGKMHVA